jgi:hypothetical protein
MPVIVGLALAGLAGLVFGAVNIYAATASSAEPQTIATTAACVGVVMGCIASGWALVVLRSRGAKR